MASFLTRPFVVYSLILAQGVIAVCVLGLCVRRSGVPFREKAEIVRTK